jgi:D-3-phosphoglycerate dehydrogenase
VSASRNILSLYPLGPESQERLLQEGLRLQIISAAELSSFQKPESIEILHLRSSPRLGKKELENFKSLRLIALGCAGYDHIDLEYCREKNIAVIHLPAANAIAVAELTVGLILQLLRDFSGAHDAMKAGIWDRERFTGIEIAGKRIGLIGFGEIGKRVAKRLLGFECKIFAHDPYLNSSVFRENSVEEASFESLLENSEVISLHLPLNSETRSLLGAKQFQRMRSGSFLVNTARGGLIDESGFLKALETGSLRAAALDVFEVEPLPKDHPFVRHPQIFLTPHLGSRSKEAQWRMESDIVSHIVDFCRTGEFKNQVEN